MGLVILGLLPGAAWAGRLKDGIAAFNRQDLGSSQRLLEEYAQQFPGDPRPHYYLHKCYEQAFEVEKTRTAINTYRTLNDRRTQVLLQLKGADPIPTYRAMLKDDPEDLAARMLLVVALLEGGAPDLARAELQALSEGAVPAELKDVYHAMWGTIYQRAGEIEKARAAFKECWSLNVDHPLPPLRLAELDKQERDRQNAQQQALFEHGDGTSARSFELTLKLGKDLLTEGNFEGAIDALQQALQLSPQHPEAQQVLVTAQQKSADIQYQKGVQFMRDQKYASAYELFQAAVKLDPTNLKAQIAAKDAKARADQAQQDVPRSN